MKEGNMATKAKYGTAAILTIYDPTQMSATGVEDIVKWLRDQAKWFKIHYEGLAPVYRAKFQYEIKTTGNTESVKPPRRDSHGTANRESV